MIQDLTISYVCNGIETILTIEDDCYDNMPYNLAEIFARVVKESDANPSMVLQEMENKLDIVE